MGCALLKSCHLNLSRRWKASDKGKPMLKVGVAEMRCLRVRVWKSSQTLVCNRWYSNWWIWYMKSPYILHWRIYKKGNAEDNSALRQSTSALTSDLDPYPQVFQIPNAIPGSVRVSATRWLGAASQKLMGSQVLMGPQVLESTYKYSWY